MNMSRKEIWEPAAFECNLKISLGKKWPKDSTPSKYKQNTFILNYSVAGVSNGRLLCQGYLG